MAPKKHIIPIQTNKTTYKNSYDVIIKKGLLDEVANHIAPFVKGGKIALITDNKLASLHLDPLKKKLTKSGFKINTICLPQGEQTKSYQQLTNLLDELLKHNINRDDYIIAYGGGVIGDLAGFCASILRRGVGLIQIPTTLLSQIDSSVGGKTGINTKYGKNLVGAFYPPELVLIDTKLLETLPPRQLKAGYGEMVKYACLDDGKFFSYLETHYEKIFSLDETILTTAIATSCQMKADIVSLDERETNDRALLNLGHSFGHALEALTGFTNDLLHGEAVAMGLVCAAQLSYDLGLCNAKMVERITSHLAQTGLPTKAEEIKGAPYEASLFLEALRQDKKTKNNILHFVLLRQLGQAFLSPDVPEKTLLSSLRHLGLVN